MCASVYLLLPFVLTLNVVIFFLFVARSVFSDASPAEGHDTFSRFSFLVLFFLPICFFNLSCFFRFLFIPARVCRACRIQYDDMALHRVLCLTLLELQSRFGDIPLEFQVVCPQNGTAVL